MGEAEERGEEQLRELKLEISQYVLSKLGDGANALEDLFPSEEVKEGGEEEQKQKKKSRQKCQYELHSLIHIKRLRQWLEEKGEVKEKDAQKRTILRKMAVMRDDKATGCAGSWLNVVPCRALGTRMMGATFTAALRWWMGPNVAKRSL